MGWPPGPLNGALVVGSLDAGYTMILHTANRTRIWVGLTYQPPIRHFTLQPSGSTIPL